jgi:hypothetical protein
MRENQTDIIDLAQKLYEEARDDAKSYSTWPMWDTLLCEDQKEWIKKADAKEALRKAAEIIGEFFSMVGLLELEKNDGRRFLYSHEEAALDWIRQQWERDPETAVCSWTANYVRSGPPPWRKNGERDK